MSDPYNAWGNRTPPPVTILPTGPTPLASIACHGSPEGVIMGSPGQRCTDIDTGDIYMKQHGWQAKGWVLVGSVGAAGVMPIG